MQVAAPPALSRNGSRRRRHRRRPGAGARHHRPAGHACSPSWTPTRSTIVDARAGIFRPESGEHRHGLDLDRGLGRARPDLGSDRPGAAGRLGPRRRRPGGRRSAAATTASVMTCRAATRVPAPGWCVGLSDRPHRPGLRPRCSRRRPPPSAPSAVSSAAVDRARASRRSRPSVQGPEGPERPERATRRYHRPRRPHRQARARRSPCIVAHDAALAAAGAPADLHQLHQDPRGARPDPQRARPPADPAQPGAGRARAVPEPVHHGAGAVRR